MKLCWAFSNRHNYRNCLRGIFIYGTKKIVNSDLKNIHSFRKDSVSRFMCFSRVTSQHPV